MFLITPTSVRIKSTARHFSEKHNTFMSQHTSKSTPHTGRIYPVQRHNCTNPWRRKKRWKHTKERGSEQRICEQRIVGAVSLGVVTGVRAESTSDRGAVLYSGPQQSLYQGEFL